jgi:hypothetical protein
VGDVSLTDTVEEVATDGAEESSVDGRKGTSSESPFSGRVVS